MWALQTPWYIITVTMVIIFILWDITNTRILDGELMSNLRKFHTDICCSDYAFEQNNLYLTDCYKWCVGKQTSMGLSYRYLLGGVDLKENKRGKNNVYVRDGKKKV
ncbi:hypothetical protein LCGC14_2210570 [marine sediment metagenome]|uniref:Uncharacterized protein n=1 Tax=marine sediment metagenome TaxID=412755 RepID=A0A0F9DDW4_9ZZZZ